MPEISVIVPVYNTEKYLPMCIDSILEQSFSDFELILADDSSPDRCPQICDEYASRDTRIRVLHLPHGGVSQARNAALDVCIGKYVVFCDSDDYVAQDYLKDMLEAQSKQPYSFVITSNVTFSDVKTLENNLTLSSKAEAKILNLDSLNEADYTALVCQYRLWGPCCKLYKKHLIDESNLRYDTDLQSAEDFAFNISYLRLINQLYYVPSSNYFYRIAWKTTKCNFIDQSAIKSAHIIVSGMTELANRANLYDRVCGSIQKIAADKFYYSRLPMVFAQGKKIPRAKRKEMFLLLCNQESDPRYMEMCIAGTKYLSMNPLMRVVAKINLFWTWQLFYCLNRIFNRIRKKQSY